MYCMLAARAGSVQTAGCRDWFRRRRPVTAERPGQLKTVNRIRAGYQQVRVGDDQVPTGHSRMKRRKGDGMRRPLSRAKRLEDFDPIAQGQIDLLADDNAPPKSLVDIQLACLTEPALQ